MIKELCSQIHALRAVLRRILQGFAHIGLLDGILGQMTGNMDIAAIAGQVGIDPAMAEKAVAGLGQTHPEPGDTVASAAGLARQEAGCTNDSGRGW